MQIYNTLTRTKEELVPRVDGKISMFVCGPTVYDYIHVGNARTFVIFDTLAKYLKHCGYDVSYIQNITDIDNKIIERAQQEDSEPLEYAKKYYDIFLEDMKTLDVTTPEYKNATNHVLEVIKQVQKLLDKGNAYVLEGDGIYFDLSTFSDYGKLSGRTASMANDAVSRIDDSDKKRNRGDFALWKFSQKGDPSWPAPFGDGRPGWHIEDTAITEKYFGPQYDIHGGGQDLIFPHHEAEIAQQESASGLKPFVRYWMHAGFLVNKESKMSKSEGNFMTLREALKDYWPKTLRFYFLSAHYRSPLDYSEERLKSAEAGVQRLGEFYWKLKSIESDLPAGQAEAKNDADDMAHQKEFNQHLDASCKAFFHSMEDDFNIPDALGWLFSFIRNTNANLSLGKIDKDSARAAIDLLDVINAILGVIPSKITAIPHEIQTVVQLREELRQDKDFEGADKLRDQIVDVGYQIYDTSYGPLIKKLK